MNALAIGYIPGHGSAYDGRWAESITGEAIVELGCSKVGSPGLQDTIKVCLHRAPRNSKTDQRNS